MASRQPTRTRTLALASPPLARRAAPLAALLVALACGLALCIGAGAQAARAATGSALLPPHNPPRALATDEYLWPSCTGAHDYSYACLESSLAMLNAGRHAEGLGPLILPANWERLTVGEQLFVLTELERTARGLPPDTGLAADWDLAAQQGADSGADPTHGGRGARGFEAVWAGGQQNPIIVVADWVYADGVFPDGSSQNLGCSLENPAGCWRHRDIVLHDSAAAACRSHCAVGAAYSPVGYRGGVGVGHESYAEVFSIDGGGNRDQLVFTWAAERRWLPACERTGDSCGWAGSAFAGPRGITRLGGEPPPGGLVIGGRRRGSGTGTSRPGSGTGRGSGARRPARGVLRRLGSGAWTVHSSRSPFALILLGRTGPRGAVRIALTLSRRLAGLYVAATLPADASATRRVVALRVGRLARAAHGGRARRRARGRYLAYARLTPGRWAVTVGYRPRGRRSARPLLRFTLVVPADAA